MLTDSDSDEIIVRANKKAKVSRLTRKPTLVSLVSNSSGSDSEPVSSRPRRFGPSRRSGSRQSQEAANPPSTESPAGVGASSVPDEGRRRHHKDLAEDLDFLKSKLHL